MSTDDTNNTEESINPASTKWELNLVLKELRKMGLKLEDDLDLNKRLWTLHNTMLQAKTGLKVAITAIIVAWAILGATMMAKFDTITELSEKINLLEYKINLLEDKVK